MNTNPRSYSTLQVAQALGVSVQTVQRWVDAGHLKAWKTVGGHRKIDADSADAWIRTMQASGDGAPAAATASAPGAPLRALVVDDDAAFLDVLATLIADTVPGASIEKARNGFEALQSMARTMPDLLVTDVVMPHIDGLEMLRHVSMQPARPGCVVVTSVLAREDVERKGALPADFHFFAKPLDQDAFAALLRSQANRQWPLRPAR